MVGSLWTFVVLAAIVAFAIVAKRVSIPYPIAFVLGGLALAFIPGAPRFTLDPNLVFIIFLPPLLYAAGWTTDWRDFRANLRPIGLLAIGLVVFTTAFVALLAHQLAPGLGWPAAIALGAIVSPPDAVAANAIFERFSIPRRIGAILNGEGLVNDASALVIYRFAVIAAVSGVFVPTSAALSLVVVSVGGIAIGLALGSAVIAITKLLRVRQLSDPLIDTALGLLAPYAIYLAADGLGVSGILATATAGVFVSRLADRLYEADSRLVAYSVWNVLTFFFEGAVFVLIGLDVRSVIHQPSFVRENLWIGVAVSLLVIALRMIWIFPAAHLPRVLFPAITRREGPPSWRYLVVLGWSGMRGVVSLAAALAIPARTASGAPFPGRDTIVFVTFCVILATLVGQGLSLIPLLRWLRLDAGENLGARELEVRVTALRAAIARLRQLEPRFDSTEAWEVEGRLLGEYEYRIAHLSGHLDGSLEESEVALDHELQREALLAERREIARLRASGEIPDEIYRRVQYDLDLADERLR